MTGSWADQQGLPAEPPPRGGEPLWWVWSVQGRRWVAFQGSCDDCGGIFPLLFPPEFGPPTRMRPVALCSDCYRARTARHAGHLPGVPAPQLTIHGNRVA